MTPFILVIFGITGDLAVKKLIPSLFSLYKQKQLPKDFFIVGFSRRDFYDKDVRSYFENLKNKTDWEDFVKHLYYQKGDFSSESGYLELIKKLEKIDEKMGACITRFFYLATPPIYYDNILDYLKQTKLSEGCGPSLDHLEKHGEDKRKGEEHYYKWTRIIIEKPFGKDLETAIALDKKLSRMFEEKQIFRVDHYLGKETVQNMMAFRFANGIFDPVWNKNYIDHVQITFAEKKGVEGRGSFFDGVGILRDIAQNHLMQLISAVAMEMPRSFSKEGIRDSRAEVIKSIRNVKEEEVCRYVVRGQYGGYKKEKNVDPNSNTETFIAMKMFVDSERFENVPFYIRAGKKMPEDFVEISIVFIQTCHILFKEYGCPEVGNVLRIRIQPDEGISIRFIAKKPGPKLDLGSVNMKFSYKESFEHSGIEAYEKILLDIFSGEQMLFNRSDELSASWDFITRILKGLKKQKGEIVEYEAGSWGPKQADELIQRDNKKWLA